MGRLAVVLSVALAGWSCGNDEVSGDTPDAAQGGQPDGGSGGGDAGTPDASLCPAPSAGLPGSPCAMDSDCDSAPGAGDGQCLNERAGWPASGYCTRGCTMPTDCPTGSSCRQVTTTQVQFSLCLADCCAGDACSTGLGCGDAIAVARLDGDSCIPANASAGDGDACNEFSDCNVSSICATDPFAIPGGQCVTLGCTVFDDSTCAPGGDGRCVDFDGVGQQPPRCVDVCEMDSDCREAEGYKCFDGTMLGVGKFCRHPDVGEPCAANTDCGADPWVCEPDPTFPNGYCSIENCTPGDPDTCAQGSVCYDPGGNATTFCAERCNMGGCRPGYTCTQIQGGQNPVRVCL